MSSQQIGLDLRHAIWLTHNRRCIYCSEPLTFAEADIDHVLPEILAGKPELNGILARLGLSQEFDLFSAENLVPAHRRCNLAKSSDVFNEASARFFLHRAEQASVNVRAIVASRKKRESREDLLLTIGEAVRSGLILPMDVHDSQPPDRLRLAKPLRFADHAEPVASISPEEVEELLDRPVLIGGNPIFAADFGDHSGVRMTVRTCREYRGALDAGFYALSTYDSKSEAFLKTANAILSTAMSVRVPLVSYIRMPHRGVADLDLFPPSILPSISPDDRERIANMKELSLGELLKRGETKVTSISSSELSIEWHYWGLLLRDVCRADFDGDGIEDILCECYEWATEGTLGVGSTIILARLSETSEFRVTRV